MAHGLAARVRPTSRTISALLAAVGTGFVLSATIGAPVAVAQFCPYPDQEKIDGVCRNVTPVPGPPEDQKVICTQHSCAVYEK
jgi:hypothetical protein